MNPIRIKNLPSFTLASFLAPILIGALAYPFWLFYLRNSDPTGKAGFFVVVALIILMTLSVAAGSALGLILALAGHVKKERWRCVRILSMSINTLIVGFGVYTFCSLPRATPQAEQDGGGNSAALRASP